MALPPRRRHSRICRIPTISLRIRGLHTAPPPVQTNTPQKRSESVSAPQPFHFLSGVAKNGSRLKLHQFLVAVSSRTAPTGRHLEVLCVALQEAGRRLAPAAAASLPRPRVSSFRRNTWRQRIAWQGYKRRAILRPGFICASRFRVSWDSS